MKHNIVMENWRQWLSSISKGKPKTPSQSKSGPVDYASKISSRAEKIADNIFIMIYHDDNNAYIYYATLLNIKEEKFAVNVDSGARWINTSLSANALKFLGASEENDVSKSDLPWGMIRLRQAPPSYNGPCSGGWTIKVAEARKGWGPLLYDVAIEFATERGNGLIPDRSEVSPMALKVWQTYLTKRSDVKDGQLDDLDNELTPDPEDNCKQKSAQDHKGEEWSDSPLSKIYSKKPTIMNQLRSKNKLGYKKS